MGSPFPLKLWCSLLRFFWQSPQLLIPYRLFKYFFVIPVSVYILSKFHKKKYDRAVCQKKQPSGKRQEFHFSLAEFLPAILADIHKVPQFFSFSALKTIVHWHELHVLPDLKKVCLGGLWFHTHTKASAANQNNGVSVLDQNTHCTYSIAQSLPSRNSGEKTPINKEDEMV